MRVLVVGAGSIGQVFGYHLRASGAEVTFLVRAEYADAVERGFDLFPLRRRAISAVALHDFAVVSSFEEVALQDFDQVYLTIPSTGLVGRWLAQLVEATGDATVVAFPIDAEDVAVLCAAGLNDVRKVEGLLSLVSYAAPMPGETRFPVKGTAYWFPPLAPTLFSGPEDRLGAVVTALGRGGLPAKRHRDVARVRALPIAVSSVWLLVLESVGWSFHELSKPDAREVGTRGVSEAIAVLGAGGTKPPPHLVILRHPGLLLGVLRVASWLVPFPLEPYVRQHFTKVSGQTRGSVKALAARGMRAGIAVETLDRLAKEPLT